MSAMDFSEPYGYAKRMLFEDTLKDFREDFGKAIGATKPTQTRPVFLNPSPVTVLQNGTLFLLVETLDGKLLACERLAESIIAPRTWDLDSKEPQTYLQRK